MPDRLSLKWIHGNTNAAVPTVPPGATYDVDDPTMWPPLSVLSGLASGFCERRAVLNPDFVTATGTTTTWVQEGDAGEADRNTIVTNLMNNLAAGTTNYASMFYAKDATMSGMSAASVSNYMNSFDSALCRLICVAGNSPETYKADINGTPYGTTDAAAFNTLAAAAYNTASAAAQTDATSAITTPVKNGGTTLKRQFGIALPVEWAKERKWMLDELKLTANDPQNFQITTLYGNYSYVIGPTNSYTSLENCRQAVLTAGVASALSNVAYYGTVAGQVGFQNTIGETVSASFIGSSVASNGILTNWRPFQAGLSDPYLRYSMEYYTTPLYISGSTQASALVTFEQDSPGWYDQSSAYDKAISGRVVSSGASVTATGTANSSYRVLSGGTLTVNSNASVYNVYVEGGGSVHINNGGYVQYCTIARNGVFTGIPNCVQLDVQGCYFTVPGDGSDEFGEVPLINSSMVGYTIIDADTYYNQGRHGSYTYISSAVLTISGSATGTSASNADGCLFIVGDGGGLYISGQPGVDTNKAYLKDCRIVVLSGGYVDTVAMADLKNTTILVYPGGTCTLKNAYYASSETAIVSIDDYSRLYIASGATATFERDSDKHLMFRCNYYLGSNCFSGTPPEDSLPTLTCKVDGATVTNTYMFQNTALYIFNPNGLCSSGTSARVQQGPNGFIPAFTNGSANLVVWSSAYATIDAPNTPPTSGPFIGQEKTAVCYRCGVESVEYPQTEVTTSNHYTTFKVRQFDPPA